MTGSRNWRTARWIGTILAALLAMAACSPAGPTASGAPAASASAATPKQGGTLTIVQPAEPINFDSRTGSNAEGIWVAFNVEDPLINFEPSTGKLVPALAESWKVSADGKQYDFTLRKGVKFSDGSPFTADDVIFTFDFLTGKRPGGQYVGQFGPFVESVTSPDPYSVVVKLTQPWVIFPELLARGWMCRILSKTAVEKAGKDYGVASLVGTGPFMLKEWIKGDHHTMVRNPNYWGTPTYLDEVIYRKVADGAARLIQIKSGQADVVYQPPLDQLDAVLSDPKLNVVAVEGNPLVFFRMNTAVTPANVFSDLNARLAVFNAIDRDQLRKTAFGNYASTAGDFMPPWHWASDPSYTGIQTNVEKAKAALTAGGFTASKPLTFDLTFYNESEYTQLGTLIQAQLKAVGIQVNLKPLDPATLDAMELANPPTFQASVTRRLYPIGTIEDYIWTPFAGNALGNRSQLNRPGGYQKPEIDSLISAARGAPDQASAKKLWRQVVDLLVGAAVVVPIAFKKNVDVVSKRVHNMVVLGTDAQLLREVWVE
jgi:peptide/nickel transport system substrate-binding protein